jgi:hypothetical protein
MAAIRSSRRHCAWQYPTNLSRAEAERQTLGWSRYEGPQSVRSEVEYYSGFLRETVDADLEASPVLRLPEGAPRPEPGLWGLSLGGNSTNWPKAHWLSLAHQVANAGKQLVLFGGPDVAPLAAEIEKRVPGCKNLAGKIGLLEGVPWLRRLELLVSNDTGFAHFSTLATDKVLVILGGGTFLRFFPWPRRKNQRVVFHGMDCFDCDWQCKYPTRECLNRVDPKAVLDMATHWLANGGPDEPTVNLNDSTCHYRSGWRRLDSGTVDISIPAGPGSHVVGA